MKVKFLKLINNERKDTKIVSRKACDSIAIDICVYVDKGNCTGFNTYDRCNKDIGKSCSDGARDVCEDYKDYDACNGMFVTDLE